jgi:SAM-dependent methyltransferase
MEPMGARADFQCRLCGGGDLRLYYTLGNAGQFRYFKCEKCALVNYDLRTGLDQEQYTREFIDPTDNADERNFDKDQSFGFIQRYVEKPGTLLDIGCGTGRLLYLARDAGWQVKGLELSGEMAEFVRSRLHIDVDVADFLDSEPSDNELGGYDVVVLRHVIEHLPDSLLAMKKISLLLKPDGYLLLEMPNIEGMTKKFSRAIISLGLHKRRFSSDFKAGHCNEFCRESMQSLANLSGYSMVRWETYSKKPVANWLYNRIPVGNKARVLLRRRANQVVAGANIK